jgi:hypothetical protein
MCTHGAHLRQSVLQSDGSLRRCAKLTVQLFNVGGEETSEWRRKTVDGVADSGLCDESRAQPPPLAPHRQGMNRMCQMKKCIAPNWNFDLEVRLGGMPGYPQMAWGTKAPLRQGRPDAGTCAAAGYPSPPLPNSNGALSIIGFFPRSLPLPYSASPVQEGKPQRPKPPALRQSLARLLFLEVKDFPLPVFLFVTSVFLLVSESPWFVDLLCGFRIRVEWSLCSRLPLLLFFFFGGESSCSSALLS